MLRNRGLLTLALADVVATLGSWVTMMALNALIIFERGGGVKESTALFLAGMAPAMVLSPVAGWLCDRYDRRLLMVISRILSALVVVGMILVDRVEALYLLLVIQSICAAVVMPARQSMVPDLVEPHDLTHANALLHQLTGVIKIVAPMMAGALLAFVRPQTAMAVDVVTYLLSAVLLYRLPALSVRKRQPSEQQQEAPSVSPLKMLRSIPVMSALLPSLFMLPLVFIAFDLTLAVLVRDVLNGSITLKSTLIGLVGLGTVLATFALMLRKGEQKPRSDIVVGLLLLTTIPIAAMLGTSVLLPTIATGVIMVSCLLGGLGQGLALVQIQTLVQTAVPSAALGRVSGIMQSVSMAGQMIGLLMTPLLVPMVISLAVLYGIGTVLMIGVTLFTLIQLRQGQQRTHVRQEVEAVE